MGNAIHLVMRQRRAGNAGYFCDQLQFSFVLPSDDPNLTHLLTAASSGDREASELLWKTLHDDLRVTARSVLRGGRTGCSLGETTLIHELYLKTLHGEHAAKWENHRHFFGSMARAMTQIVIDHHRAANRAKRGGGHRQVQLLSETAAVASFEEMVQVADSGLLKALERLQVDAPLSADVVWLRYIAGLSVEQTALALDVSPRTVNNHWLHARAWLRRALASNPSDDMT